MNALQWRRCAYVGGILAGSALGFGLLFYALSETLQVFYTPSALRTAQIAPDAVIRVGGWLVPGSVVHAPDLRVQFVLRDAGADCRVEYQGLLPDLFKEGSGVVAEGSLVVAGDPVGWPRFRATRVLAKHDARYQPQGIAADLADPRNLLAPRTPGADPRAAV